MSKLLASFCLFLLCGLAIATSGWGRLALDNSTACGNGHYLGCIFQTCVSSLLTETYFNSLCYPAYNSSVCDTLWAEFSAPWFNITDNNTLDLITENNSYYQTYINSFNWTTSTSMFWSGTGTCDNTYYLTDLVHPIAAALGYKILEKIPAVAFVNEHHFCDASLYTPGVGCNGGYGPGFNGSEQGFFRAASRRYASNVTGDVAITISPKGSRMQAAYSNATIFATVELPSMNPALVTSFTIYAYTDWRMPNESCRNPSGNSSIDQLVAAAQAHFNPGTPVYCYNDPPCILKIICKYVYQVNRTNYNNKIICCEQIFDDNLLPNNCTVDMNENFCASFQKITSSHSLSHSPSVSSSIEWNWTLTIFVTIIALHWQLLVS